MKSLRVTVTAIDVCVKCAGINPELAAKCTHCAGSGEAPYQAKILPEEAERVALAVVSARLAELVEHDSEQIERHFTMMVHGIPVCVTPEHVLAVLFPDRKDAGLTPTATVDTKRTLTLMLHEFAAEDYDEEFLGIIEHMTPHDAVQAARARDTFWWQARLATLPAAAPHTPEGL